MQCNNLETQKTNKRITDDSFMGQVGEKRPPVTETRVSYDLWFHKLVRKFENKLPSLERILVG